MKLVNKLTDCHSSASSRTSFFIFLTSSTFLSVSCADLKRSQGPTLTNCSGLAAGLGAATFVMRVGMYSMPSV